MNAKDMPSYLQALSWMALGHGTLEFLTYTSIFILLPVKLIIVGKLRYKIASLFFMLLFLYLRLMYIPLILNLLPFQLAFEIPYFLREQSFYVVLLSYSLFGIVPIMCAMVSIFTQRIWKRKLRIKEYPPKISVLMPIYNEDINDLLAAVHSVLDSEFLGSITLYCTFDDDDMSPIYLSLLKEFNIPLAYDLPTSVLIKINSGIGARELVVTRCVHGGKRVTQGNAWYLVQQRTSKSDRKHHHVLMMDSDVVLDRYAINNMACALERDLRKKAITGFLSCTNNGQWYNPLVYYQNAEYMQGQLVMRVMEHALGGITCLPGAFTMVRYKVLKRLGKVYFGDLNQKSTLNYHRFYLGEDRFLTHLLMQNYECGATGICVVAHASTPAVTGFKSFLNQRRRWLLGAVANEAWMIVSFELWQRIPLLLIWRMLEFCNRFMSAYAILFVVFFATGYITNIYVMFFFAFPFIGQWLVIAIYCLRYKIVSVIFTFPLMMLLNLFFYTLVYVYGILTFFTRSWGGPRTRNNNLLGVENANDLYEELMTSSSPTSNSNRFSRILRRISQKRKNYRESQLGVAAIIDDYFDKPGSIKRPTRTPKQTKDNARAQPLPAKKHVSNVESNGTTLNGSIHKSISMASIGSNASINSMQNIAHRGTLYDQAIQWEKEKELDRLDENEVTLKNKNNSLKRQKSIHNKKNSQPLIECDDRSIISSVPSTISDLEEDNMTLGRAKSIYQLKQLELKPSVSFTDYSSVVSFGSVEEEALEELLKRNGSK